MGVEMMGLSVEIGLGVRIFGVNVLEGVVEIVGVLMIVLSGAVLIVAVLIVG
jgi:hypothetical protein